MPSRFLNEVPPSLRERLSPAREVYGQELDLFAEQSDVRESVKKNLYTGRTYNSVENIAAFFSERGMPLPSGLTRRPQSAPSPAPATDAKGDEPRGPRAASTPASVPSPASTPKRPTVPPVTRPPSGRKQIGIVAGATVKHPVYGRGTVLRREGDGEDAKLTISFPGHGLKKIVEKYAGIKVDE